MNAHGTETPVTCLMPLAPVRCLCSASRAPSSGGQGARTGAAVLPSNGTHGGPRITWDAHSAFGFWFLILVTLWSVSGLYLSQSPLFDELRRLDPQDRVVDDLLFVLAQLHFGRFNRVMEVIWAVSSLVPAILALTGLFICCWRSLLGRPWNPKHAVIPFFIDLP
jgi:uncharacterized iron-regulated membrane protein